MEKIRASTPLLTRLKSLSQKLQTQVRLQPSEKRPKLSDLDESYDRQLRLSSRETSQPAGFQIAWAWQQSNQRSADYFDVFMLNKDTLGLCIADVSGKGANATQRMESLRGHIKKLVYEEPLPSRVCAQLNRTLCESIALGKYVAFLYAVLDQRSRRLTYESAGHCLPLLVHQDGAIEILRASSGVLGLFSHWTFSDHEIQLRAGDVLVMATDGILSAGNAQEEEFGYQRLFDSVLTSRNRGAHELCECVLNDVEKFCNGQFEDDASLMVVSVDENQLA